MRIYRGIIKSPMRAGYVQTGKSMALTNEELRNLHCTIFDSLVGEMLSC